MLMEGRRKHLAGLRPAHSACNVFKLPTEMILRIRAMRSPWPLDMSNNPFPNEMATTSKRKYILITGCSDGGIGSSLAEAFHERGYHVFATLRNLSKVSSRLSAEAAKKDENSNGSVTMLQLDVFSPNSIAAAVASVKAATGGRGLDVLVNNSGQAEILPALDTDIDEARKIFGLNYWAPLAMVKAFAPLLIEAGGCLVNNASVSAYMPMPFSGAY